jgi:CDGSH-type Zn-finger protein/uncharacterized Fe-S cluster protein YjdI
MSEKYTGKAMDKCYTGKNIDVTFNLGRCVHSAICLQKLADVFDVNQRPWVRADNAEADRVAATIALCPSGALHFERKDGGADEAAPPENAIVVRPNGPLQLHGDLVIESADVDIAQETRATLCRCGQSQNKPFCDNGHRQAGFKAAGGVSRPQAVEAGPAGGSLKVSASPNGPLLLAGNFEIRDARGEVLYRGAKAALCRCGGSANKPFCDGNHRQLEFLAD